MWPFLESLKSKNPLFADGRVKPDITPPSMAQASEKIIYPKSHLMIQPNNIFQSNSIQSKTNISINNDIEKVQNMFFMSQITIL